MATMNTPEALAALDAIKKEARPGVVIIGSGWTASALRPYAQSSEWELWCCNDLMTRFPKKSTMIETHRWFQLHPLSACSPTEVSWAKLCPIPIYCVDGTEGVPMAISYPLDEIKKLTLAQGGFASSFAYQLALAILEGKERIAIVGVDYFRGGTIREMTVEGPNLLWWIAGSIGLGIDVTMGFDPRMPMDGYLYGIEYWDERKAVAEWCLNMERKIYAAKVDG